MKTVQEWLEQFNLLYDNITSGQAPGLTNEEICTFLTQAQDQIVDGIYSGNLITGGYETDERAREILAPLNQYIRVEGSVAVGDTIPEDDLEYYGYKKIRVNLDADDNDKSYERIRYKTVQYFSYDDKTYQVIPIKRDDLLRTLPNPFRGGNRFRVITIDGEESTEDNRVVDLFYKFKGDDFDTSKVVYTMHYIRNPKPFTTVETAIGCELPEEIHNTILTTAVNLAKAVWKA